MQSSRPRQCSGFTLLWTSNGGRESQPLNLSPIRNFKRNFFIWKTCVISSHIASHFFYVLILSEISKIVCSIGRRYLSIDWNVNKYIFKSLDDSIDSRFTIDWSKGILDRSKNGEIPHEVSGWLDQFLIPARLIERNIRSISWTKFFQFFFFNCFWSFTWTKHSPLIISE